MDPEELVALQRRHAADLLASAEDPQALIDVCRELAGTLREVSDDDRLWEDLEQADDDRLAQDRLAQLQLLDWPSLLRAADLDDHDEALIDELTLGLIRALSRPS